MKGNTYLLRLPDDVNYELKMRALKDDCYKLDVILTALRAYLKTPEAKK